MGVFSSPMLQRSPQFIFHLERILTSPKVRRGPAKMRIGPAKVRRGLAQVRLGDDPEIRPSLIIALGEGRTGQGEERTGQGEE